MNNCIKLILILIVILVIFTFVTGAHKGTEHFNRECNKTYISQPTPKTTAGCPRECSKVSRTPDKKWVCTERQNLQTN